MIWIKRFLLVTIEILIQIPDMLLVGSFMEAPVFHFSEVHSQVLSKTPAVYHKIPETKTLEYGYATELSWE